MLKQIIKASYCDKEAMVLTAFQLVGSLFVIISYLFDVGEIAWKVPIIAPIAVFACMLFTLACILFTLFCDYMLIRNDWVGDHLGIIINKNEFYEYEKYNTILNRFWVWDIEKFRIKKK